MATNTITATGKRRLAPQESTSGALSFQLDTDIKTLASTFVGQDQTNPIPFSLYFQYCIKKMCKASKCLSPGLALI